MFYRIDVKSLVWYNPITFDEAGYDVPETMEELKELTEEIVDDGGTPWCIGLGSGAATGWPATDWVEDMMLRTARARGLRPVGVERDPLRRSRRWSRRSRNSAGSPRTTISSRAAPRLRRRRTSATAPPGFSPSRRNAHAPAGVVHPGLLPRGCGAGRERRLLLPSGLSRKRISASRCWARGRSLRSPTPRTLPTRCSSSSRCRSRTRSGWRRTRFLTAHLGVNTDVYANEALKQQGEILQDATTFRFDACDLMPSEIGAGAFWTGMVDYVTGADAESVAADIQSRWDSLN